MRVDLSGIPDQPVSTADLRRVLLDDLFECWADLKNADTQIARRNYVRAAFAFIEGFTAVMKSGALAEFNAGRATLSMAEVALLLEESYSASDDGKPLVRGWYVPFAQNIRFAFDVFGRTHGVPERPDYSDDGWRDLKDAFQIRNRVTHPKVTTDLNVSDEELRSIDRAWEWFLEASFVLFEEGKAQLILKLKPMGLEPNI